MIRFILILLFLFTTKPIFSQTSQNILVCFESLSNKKLSFYTSTDPSQSHQNSLVQLSALTGEGETLNDSIFFEATPSTLSVTYGNDESGDLYISNINLGLGVNEKIEVKVYNPNTGQASLKIKHPSWSVKDRVPVRCSFYGDVIVRPSISGGN